MFKVGACEQKSPSRDACIRKIPVNIRCVASFTVWGIDIKVSEYIVILAIIVSKSLY